MAFFKVFFDLIPASRFNISKLLYRLIKTIFDLNNSDLGNLFFKSQKYCLIINLLIKKLDILNCFFKRNFRCKKTTNKNTFCYR